MYTDDDNKLDKAKENVKEAVKLYSEVLTSNSLEYNPEQVTNILSKLSNVFSEMLR